MSNSTRQDSTSNWAHPIRAVAFDMDGLMVNTEELYSEVGSILLGRRGRKFTPALKSRIMGLPGSLAFQVIIDHESLTDSIEVLAEESAEIFEGILPSKLQLLPGVEALLDKLAELELPRCVATSSTRHFAEQVLGLVRLRDRFSFVVTAEDVTHGKPAPDIYLLAAKKMGIPIEQTLVLEDSHHGSRAGVRSGACTIAVPGDHSRDHDFTGVSLTADTLCDPRIREFLPGKMAGGRQC